MVQVLHSELDMVCGDRIIVKIYLSTPVPDSRFIVGFIAVPGNLVVCMYLVLGERADVKLIVIESDCGIAEQFVVKDVIPASRNDGVAPVHFSAVPVLVFVTVVSVVILCHEMVFAIVCTEEEAAPVGEFMVDFGIDVIKVITVLFFFRHEGFGQQVDVGAAGRNVERSPVLDDRPFEIEFAGQESYTDYAMIVLHVAIIGAYVNYGGEASAEAGGERTFEEGYFLYGFGSEDREES